MNVSAGLRAGSVALLLVFSAAAGASAGGRQAAGQPEQVGGDNYDVLFERYLRTARETSDRSPNADIAWMSGLTGDPRARAVNDLLTVRVIESIIGSGTADSALDKSSSGAASVTGLFGLENKVPDWLDPTNLFGASAGTDFRGSGSTSRTGELVAIMTVRVADVLPGGNMVVEGVKEIDINGDRQIVVLTGIVRPTDVARNNVVLSTEIGQLRIRYFGRGLIKDNLRPGWLIRVLNKIF